MIKINNNIYYKKNRKNFLIILIFVLFIVILRKNSLFEGIRIDSPEELQEIIKQYGAFGPIIYVLLYMFASVFLIPCFPLSVGVRLIYGPIWGSVLVMIALSVSVSVCFCVTRVFGRKYVESKFNGRKDFELIKKGVEKQGYKMVVLTRIIPIVPTNIQSYAYGLSGVSFEKHLMVSLIAMIPGNVACSLIVDLTTKWTNYHTISNATIRIYLIVTILYVVSVSVVLLWLKKEYKKSSTDIKTIIREFRKAKK